MLYHLILSLSLLSACNSYQQFHHISQEFEIPSRVFRANYGETWQAALAVLKKYDLEVINQESGLLKTRWHNNTLELNFADSFGGSDSVKTAKYKLILNISKGFQENREVSKVSLYKRQMVEQDFLQGWKVVPSDGITEKKVLYRIQRVLFIEGELKKIQDIRLKEAESEKTPWTFFKFKHKQSDINTKGANFSQAVVKK